ncbi:MAG: MotA/TolQ/ExbB proton channel family protein [Kiritimatiellia bacterium]
MKYLKITLVAIMACGWMFGTAGVLSAQETSPRAAVETVEKAGESGEAGLTTRWIVESGGAIFFVLIGISFAAVALIAYFFAVLRPSQVAPKALFRELLDKIEGGAFEEARRTCDYRPCPLSDVAGAVIDYVREVPAADPLLMKDVMEGEGARQADAIQGQTQYLMDIAVVSPMIGLLGTVWGMLNAFTSLGLETASAKPVAVAMGVSKALVTTAAGLVVGIVAMAFYAYFRRKASRLVSCLESASTRLLTAFLSKKQV